MLMGAEGVGVGAGGITTNVSTSGRENVKRVDTARLTNGVNVNQYPLLRGSPIDNIKTRISAGAFRVCFCCWLILFVVWQAVGICRHDTAFSSFVFVVGKSLFGRHICVGMAR